MATYGIGIKFIHRTYSVVATGSEQVVYTCPANTYAVLRSIHCTTGVFQPLKILRALTGTSIVITPDPDEIFTFGAPSGQAYDFFNDSLFGTTSQKLLMPGDTVRPTINSAFGSTINTVITEFVGSN